MSTIEAIKAVLGHPQPSSTNSANENGNIASMNDKDDGKPLFNKRQKSVTVNSENSYNGKGDLKGPLKKVVNKEARNQTEGNQLNPDVRSKLQSPKQASKKLKKASATSQSGFSEQQLDVLKRSFARNKEPGLVERKSLAREIKATEFQISGWFRKARGNSSTKSDPIKKELTRPHFLASKLVQPANAKRHMERSSTNKVAKNISSSKPTEKKELQSSWLNKTGQNTQGLGRIFSNLKPGSRKAKRSPELPLRNNKTLNEMTTIAEKNHEVAASFSSRSKSSDCIGKNRAVYDEDILILNGVKRPEAEVIDIDEDQDQTMIVHEDASVNEGTEYDKRKKAKKNVLGRKVENKVGVQVESLEKELKEKTKIIKDLEIKIPQMISEFKKCVGDKDEVIAEKDKEIKTNKQKIANYEKDIKLLHSRNKSTLNDLSLKEKEIDTFKKDFGRNGKEKVEHQQKTETLEAKISKLQNLLTKKDDEIAKLSTKSKDLQKKDDESKKLLAKEKDFAVKLKAKDKEMERKLKTLSQENCDKIKELEDIIKIKEQSLKSSANQSSIKIKSTMDSQQKQISLLRLTVKNQEKEIFNLKEKEVRLKGQIVDLQRENYLKAEEIESKRAELDKILTEKVETGKNSVKRKLSIYEATKDYIEQLRENRRQKANLKKQFDNEELDLVEDNDDDSVSVNGRSQLFENCNLQNMGHVRSRSEHYFTMISHHGYRGHNGQCSVVPIHLLEQTLKGSMVSHTHPGYDNPLITHTSMITHMVCQEEWSVLTSDTVNEQILDVNPVSADSSLKRKIAVRSRKGVWGQVYRYRALELDQGIEGRRIGKRRASKSVAEVCENIPAKKRKLSVKRSLGVTSNKITELGDPVSKAATDSLQCFSLVAHSLSRSHCSNSFSLISHLVADHSIHSIISAASYQDLTVLPHVSGNKSRVSEYPLHCIPLKKEHSHGNSHDLISELLDEIVYFLPENNYQTIPILFSSLSCQDQESKHSSTVSELSYPDKSLSMKSPSFKSTSLLTHQVTSCVQSQCFTALAHHVLKPKRQCIPSALIEGVKRGLLDGDDNFIPNKVSRLSEPIDDLSFPIENYHRQSPSVHSTSFLAHRVANFALPQCYTLLAQDALLLNTIEVRGVKRRVSVSDNEESFLSSKVTRMSNSSMCQN